MGTTGLSITLANSIIGVGILAMPFCFQQCGVLLAALILLLMGLVSRLCCYFLLKSALLARRRNFEFLAFHVFGPAGKMAVEVGIIGFLMGTCIAYFVVVGDLGPQIIANMFNIYQSDILRTSIMVIVSLVCVLPLGLLRNVDSLSNVSAATIGFYFCLVMKVIAEAASQLWSAEWQRRVQLWRPAGVLQCVPILSMALFCQTQLFEIFESLPILSLEKMNIVTKNAINICSGVYLTLGVFGYIAFSSHEISGNILMSLSPTMASDVIKLGFVMSLAFSFPLIIFPCRASLYSFLYKKVHSSHHDHIINHSIPETTFRCITVAIVAVALFISLLIPNIELVLGLVGSTIGVLICVVFPAACFVNVTFKNTNERVLAKAVVVLGLIIMVLGTYANLQAAENIDRYDDKYITQERIDKMVEDFFEKRQNNDLLLRMLVSNLVVIFLTFISVLLGLTLFKELIAKPISNGNEVLNEIIKDSEVQPPNPVPPESQSVEKIAPNVIPVIKESNKLKAVPEPTNNIDKVSEAHPKNVLNKLNGARTNGENNKNTDVNHDNDAPVINNIEKPKEESKPTSNEDKIQINKQKQLIETIKQHGEEQKELIQEQKEILDEIIKTKQELQQNKNEDSVQAKKIAVESIKQIANMAIQSIGGVTDKPVGEEVKKSDRLEKLTNDAVKEIAKKAVETIEAIHDIKDKPLLPKSKDDKPVNVANGLDLESNVMNKLAPVENSIQNEVINGIDNSQKQTQNIEAQEPIKNEPAMNPPVDTNAKLIVNEDNITKAIKNEPAVNLPVDTNVKSIVNDDRIAKANVPANSPVQEEKPRETKLDSKNHSHSPDEPQSYKQGEDAQKNEGVIQNVPLPLMNLQAKDKEPIFLSNDNNVNSNVQMNAANLKNGDTLPRQKREVVDCSETTLIKPEDIQICEKLKDTKDLGLNEILKPVDLNDVNLKKMPLNGIIIGRSLKSYDEIKNQR